MGFIDKVEGFTYRAQRLVLPRAKLAPEFTETDITQSFKPNGSVKPRSSQYKALARHKFATWRLEIDGLVETPFSLTLAELRSAPARTQITRHDCVEGWSVIGKWTGVPLSLLLDRAKPKDNARFVVFHCFDSPDTDQDGGGDADQSTGDEGSDENPASYYESIDFVDAYHPQTILAYELNGAPLPEANGAPLRVRVERQLGYKMAKYIRRIEVVEDYTKFGKGGGGYWEDRGYEWYAGV